MSVAGLPCDGGPCGDPLVVGPRDQSDQRWRFPTLASRAPQSDGSSPVVLYVYVQDVDAVFNRAIAAGAKLKKPIQNHFYGDRSGTLVDPFGHTWTIATHVEDVSPEEINRRMGAMKPAT